MTKKSQSSREAASAFQTVGAACTKFPRLERLWARSKNGKGPVLLDGSKRRSTAAQHGVGMRARDQLVHVRKKQLALPSLKGS